MSSEHAIIMLHYVHRRDTRRDGVRPLWLDEFDTLLDGILERADIVGPATFLERAIDRPNEGRPTVLLTFDDGTRDHYEIVAPRLRDRGLTGLFFVPTWPLDGRMPLAHAVHWALGEAPQQTWEALLDEAAKARVPVGTADEAAQQYSYEEPGLRQRIKYAVNMRLPAEVAEVALRQAWEHAGYTERQLTSEWFVSEDELVELARMGMHIGMHGESHKSLQTLGPAGITAEIHGCAERLTRLLGKKPTWFACPFGGHRAAADVHASMNRALVDVGVHAAVTTQRGTVTHMTHPLALPRFDVIEVPPRAGQWPW